MPGRADDERFMAAAIGIARTHLGRTGTNPSVGCVIVKDGVVVGQAVTALGGRPHAEPQALAEAGEKALGATAYVTLEPCSHYGKTPPCANALITAGIARVVVSVTDPDARVSGRGLEMLRAAGIAVETGVLEEEGRRALAGYLMRQTKGRPYVTVKLALSSDGMIGRQGEGQIRITGTEARAEVQRLRAESDAILVGIGTAVADDPELTVRIPGMEDRSPIRIVLDPLLALPLDGKLATTARQVPVIVVASETVSPLVADAEGVSPVADVTGRAEGDVAPSAEAAARRAALEALGVEVVYCNPYNPEILLPALGSRGLSSLFVEGGAKTVRLFLEAGLVDRILLFEGQGAIGEGGIESPVTKDDMPSGFTHVGTRLFGADRCDEYEREL